VTGQRVVGTRTYLEMTNRAQLVRAAMPDTECRVEQLRDCAPEFWRFL